MITSDQKAYFLSFYTGYGIKNTFHIELPPPPFTEPISDMKPHYLLLLSLVIFLSAISTYANVPTPTSAVTDSATNLMPENGTALISDVDITDGLWHHIGLIYDGEIRKLYVDGRIATQDNESLDGNLTWCDGMMNIGGDKTLAGFYYWDGLIDDVRIYDSVLSDKEIMSVEQGFAGGDVRVCLGDLLSDLDLSSDLNDDCAVDMEDIIILAEKWLDIVE